METEQRIYARCSTYWYCTLSYWKVKSINSMYDPKNDIKAVNFYWVYVVILCYNTHLFCQSIKLWK